MSHPRPLRAHLDEALHKVMELSTASRLPHLTFTNRQHVYTTLIAGATEKDLSKTVQTEGAAKGWTGWAVMAFSQWISNDLSPEFQPNIMSHWRAHHSSGTDQVFRIGNTTLPLGNTGLTVTTPGLWALGNYLYRQGKMEGGTHEPSWATDRLFETWSASASDISAMWATTRALLEAVDWLPSRVRPILARQLQAVLLVDTTEEAENRDLLDRLSMGPWYQFHASFTQSPFADQFSMMDQWTRLASLRRSSPEVLPLPMTKEEDVLWHREWAKIMIGACQDQARMTAVQVRRQLSWIRANVNDQVRAARRYKKVMPTASGPVIAEVLDALVQRQHHVDVPDWASRYAQLSTTGEAPAQALDRLHAKTVAQQRQLTAAPLPEATPSRRFRP